MSLSLPAGPETRRRPSHLKGFLRLLPFLLATMGLAWLALDGLLLKPVTIESLAGFLGSVRAPADS